MFHGEKCRNAVWLRAFIIFISYHHSTCQSQARGKSFRYYESITKSLSLLCWYLLKAQDDGYQMGQRQTGQNKEKLANGSPCTIQAESVL